MQIKIAYKIIFLLFFVLIGGCSHVDEITPRSYVALLISDTKQERGEIEQALSKGNSVPNQGKFEIKPRADGLSAVSTDFAWITAGGVMVLSNEKYGVLLIQEPVIMHGRVIWNYIVYPADAKPNSFGKK